MKKFTEGPFNFWLLEEGELPDQLFDRVYLPDLSEEQAARLLPNLPAGKITYVESGKVEQFLPYVIDQINSDLTKAGEPELREGEPKPLENEPSESFLNRWHEWETKTRIERGNPLKTDPNMILIEIR